MRTAEPADLAIVGAQLIDGTEVVDAAGKTVIPGLVDLHAHSVEYSTSLG